MAYLDRYIYMASVMLAEHNEKLVIEAPKDHNTLWIVWAEGHGVDHARSSTSLGTAIEMLLFERFSVPARSSVKDEGQVYEAAKVLARIGDALKIERKWFGDEYKWALSSLQKDVIAINGDFDEAAREMNFSSILHLRSTIYANDNCPLD